MNGGGAVRVRVEGVRGDTRFADTSCVARV
jgi:hypothetical protein